MGWPRLVGSLKLQVSFAEYSLFHRALLCQLIVATPDVPTNVMGLVGTHITFNILYYTYNTDTNFTV